MNKVVKKENGQVIAMESSRELERAIKGTHQMCWNCANARPDKCSKVGDLEKKGLDSYDYISDGYQIINNNNEIDTFIVTNCNNYVKDEARMYNTATKEKLKQLKEDIMTNYFDAGSVDEAYLIQDKQLKSTSENNVLVNPRGKKPSRYQIEAIKRRNR